MLHVNTDLFPLWKVYRLWTLAQLVQLACIAEYRRSLALWTAENSQQGREADPSQRLFCDIVPIFVFKPLNQAASRARDVVRRDRLN